MWSTIITSNLLRLVVLFIPPRGASTSVKLFLSPSLSLNNDSGSPATFIKVIIRYRYILFLYLYLIGFCETFNSYTQRSTSQYT